MENKPFVLNAYRCISREQMERFLFELTYGLIRGVVEEQAKDAKFQRRKRRLSRIFINTALWG